MLTREEAIAKTREMWNWIADETEKRGEIVQKDDYFRENDIPIPTFFCFLCEFAFSQYGYSADSCYLCPFDWGVIGPCACENPSTPYHKWRRGVRGQDSCSPKKMAKLARMIAHKRESRDCL